MSMEIYRATNIELSVNSGHKLKNISFSIPEKEITMIHSYFEEANTIIRLLAYKNKPESGELFYASQNLAGFSQTDIEEWRISDVQFVSYKDSLFDDLKVIDNILLPIWLNRIIHIDDIYIDKVLEELDLTELQDKKYKTLNNVDKIKVKLARALVTKPFVILIEDIYKNLSSVEANMVIDIISHINNVYHVTIVESTNYKPLLNTASNKIEIEDGKIKNA